MVTFTVSFKDHIRHLWMYFLVVLGFPMIVYSLMIYKWGYHDKWTALVIIVTGITFYSILHISLHLNYYLHDRKIRFFYNNITGDSTYVKGADNFVFSPNDINKITVFKTKPLANRLTPIFVWDEYNYAIIELKSGKILKISSLLVFELDKVFRFENTVVKITFYPWM